MKDAHAIRNVVHHEDHPHAAGGEPVFDQACDALGGLERAQLMQEAVLFEAFRLGTYFTVTPPAALKEPWRYLSDRSEEPTEIRVSISLRLTVAELMARAAELVGASEPLFIIGATIAYVWS